MVKVSDVLTGFCHAPEFCDGHTDTHCQFLTQLKLRIGILNKLRHSTNLNILKTVCHSLVGYIYTMVPSYGARQMQKILTKYEYSRTKLYGKLPLKNSMIQQTKYTRFSKN